MLKGRFPEGSSIKIAFDEKSEKLKFVKSADAAKKSKKEKAEEPLDEEVTDGKNQ